MRAACADCIALEVFGLELTIGEDGFIGSGGGARSGSELSHLEAQCQSSIPRPKVEAGTYIGITARPQSDDADC